MRVVGKVSAPRVGGYRDDSHITGDYVGSDKKISEGIITHGYRKEALYKNSFSSDVS